MKQILGRDLRVGDVIAMWKTHDRITSLRPYIGNLAQLWNGEARIARFTREMDMTIEPDASYTLSEETDTP
jgi:hypothetical protein